MLLISKTLGMPASLAKREPRPTAIIIITRPRTLSVRRLREVSISFSSPLEAM